MFAKIKTRVDALPDTLLEDALGVMALFSLLIAGLYLPALV